jgi:hypothetical protein
MISSGLMTKALASGFCLVAGVTLGMGLRGDKVYESLSASEFLLRDSSGRIYARMAVDHGSPRLEYLDKRGGTAMSLFLNGGAGALVLSSPNGSVSIMAAPTPTLALCQRDGTERVRIDLSGNAGAPEVSVLDGLGRTRGSLSLDPEGTASMSLAMDKDAMPDFGVLNRVLELGVSADGSASVALTSDRGLKKKQIDLHLMLDPDGNCALEGREQILRELARALTGR